MDQYSDSTDLNDGLEATPEAGLLADTAPDSYGFVNEKGTNSKHAMGLATYVCTLVFFSFTWIAIVALSIYQHPHAADNQPSCFCGHNLTEARANGCVYDSVATAWLPPACRDEENTAEFDRSGPGPDGQWTYYTDWDMTGTMTLSEIAQLPETGGAFYTTHLWHLQHCLYTFRKIWRAPTTGVTIEKRFDTDAHLKHCGQMFLLRRPLDDAVTGSGVTLNADRLVHTKH